MENKISLIKELFEQNKPLFSALGDPKRQEIMLLMADSHLSVGELTDLTNLSRPAVSHHIKVLLDAKLLTVDSKGTKRYYRPSFKSHIEPLRKLIDNVEQIEI